MSSTITWNFEDVQVFFPSIVNFCFDMGPDAGLFISLDDMTTDKYDDTGTKI